MPYEALVPHPVFLPLPAMLPRTAGRTAREKVDRGRQAKRSRSFARKVAEPVIGDVVSLKGVVAAYTPMVMSAGISRFPGDGRGWIKLDAHISTHVGLRKTYPISALITPFASNASRFGVMT